MPKVHGSLVSPRAQLQKGPASLRLRHRELFGRPLVDGNKIVPWRPPIREGNLVDRRLFLRSFPCAAAFQLNSILIGNRRLPGRFLLVLLRHKFIRVRRAVEERQHGHLGKRLTRASMMGRRAVAIEFGTWRSGRNGGSSGSVTVGYGKLREPLGGTRS